MQLKNLLKPAALNLSFLNLWFFTVKQNCKVTLDI